MRLWIELSGEHPTLPRAEALAAMEAECVRIREVSWSAEVLHLDAEGDVDRVLARLGLAHVACEELARGDWADIRAFAKSMDLAGRRFRTRVRSLGPEVDGKPLEGFLGADLGRTGRVDLSTPEVEFRLLVGDTFHLGRVIRKTARSSLERRKVARRTFIRPISLHPKFCRALVNLARIPAGAAVLDPFCGTGGVLIEAASMGLRPVGADVRLEMVRGSEESLRELGLRADLLVGDAGRGPWRAGRIAGIATDPPYGRAASTRGEAPLKLYTRAFAAFSEILPTGGFVAAALPSEAAIAAAEEHLELVERYALRVHRSLTRNFCAFVKRP